MIGYIQINHHKCEIQFILEGKIVAENKAMSVLQENPDQDFLVNWTGEMTFQSKDSPIYPIEHQSFIVAPFVASWNTLKNTNSITFSFTGLMDPRPVDAFFRVSFPYGYSNGSIDIGNFIYLIIFVEDNVWYDNFTVNTFGEHSGFNILEANSIFKRFPTLSQSFLSLVRLDYE
jgi:hypothetical protein